MSRGFLTAGDGKLSAHLDTCGGGSLNSEFVPKWVHSPTLHAKPLPTPPGHAGAQSQPAFHPSSRPRSHPCFQPKSQPIFLRPGPSGKCRGVPSLCDPASASEVWRKFKCCWLALSQEFYEACAIPPPVNPHGSPPPGALPGLRRCDQKIGVNFHTTSRGKKMT